MMKYSLRYLLAAAVLTVAGVLVALRPSPTKAAGERTYTGVASCMTSGCHAGQYGDGHSYKGAADFLETMHQKIHLRPTPETVVIDRLFSEGKELKYWDNRIRAEGKDTLVIRLSKGDGPNDYYIQLLFSNGGDSLPKMKVAYTYGGNGWIQRYLVQINNSYYVAPFQYVLPSYRERTDTGGFYFLDVNRWYRVDANLQNGAEFFNWETNDFRKQSWDKNCSACHVNGFDVQKVTANGDTSWYANWVGVFESDSATMDQNIEIGCESCHGPGSEHVANPTKDNIFSPGQLPKTAEATQLKLDMCNQCHKRLASLGGEHSFGYDESTRTPYTVGNILKDFSKPAPNVWADGQTAYAHHQQGDDYEHSYQYTNHLFTEGCSDCHLSHYNKPGLPYQLNADWYSLEDGVGCMSCHGSPEKSQPPADNLGAVAEINGKMVNKHSMHAPEISQCVNCHFTHTSTIAFTGSQEFSDHSFRVIRPKATLDFYKEPGQNPYVGMINTCAASCHRNGRGSRNSKPGDPEAPAFGTHDDYIYSYKDKADSILADTLWKAYQVMYKDIMKPSGVGPGEIPEVHDVRLTMVTPNPFVGAARIDFEVDKSQSVTIEIYDITGRLVRVLARQRYATGSHSVVWEGVDDQGAPVLSGNYFVRLTTAQGTDNKRIVFMR